jgi:hypothetical protein
MALQQFLSDFPLHIHFFKLLLGLSLWLPPLTSLLVTPVLPLVHLSPLAHLSTTHMTDIMMLN